jgi:hypothetical protein
MTKKSWALFLLWIISGFATGVLISMFLENGDRSFPGLIAASAITALGTTAVIIQKVIKALKNFNQTIGELFKDQ